MSERARRVVRDGPRELVFDAVVLGATTSQRPGVPRWSELTIYGLDNGQYVLSKVGRSLVAHKETCRKVDHRMPTWAEAGARGEAKIRRIWCLECSSVEDQNRPADHMDPQDRLEEQRYKALVAATADDLVDVVTDGKPMHRWPLLVDQVLRQAAAADAAVASALTGRRGL